MISCSQVPRGTPRVLLPQGRVWKGRVASSRADSPLCSDHRSHLILCPTPRNWNRAVYLPWYTVAVVTDSTTRGFHNTNAILSWFWRPEIQNQGAGGALLLLKAPGRPFHASSRASGGCWHSLAWGWRPALCPRLHMAFCLCVSSHCPVSLCASVSRFPFLFIDTSHIGVGAHPKSYPDDNRQDPSSQ